MSVVSYAEYEWIAFCTVLHLARHQLQCKEFPVFKKINFLPPHEQPLFISS